MVKKKKLTNEETINLIINYRVHNDKNALDTLLNEYKGLIVYILKKYLNRGLSYDELLSAGNFGLIKAINNIDYNVENNNCAGYFYTYIEGYIKNEINQYKKHHDNAISFEQPIITSSKDGDELKLEDILGTDSEETINEVIEEMKINVVKDALKCLTTREKQIILMRYGLDDAHKKTVEEVAKYFDCTTRTIYNQEQKALKKMRHPKNTKRLKDFIED